MECLNTLTETIDSQIRCIHISVKTVKETVEISETVQAQVDSLNLQICLGTHKEIVDKPFV